MIGEMRVDPNKRNVILSHQFIIGGTTSDSERRNIGTLENVDAALYDAFVVTMGDEARESIIAAMKLGLEAAKSKNKARFAPNKNKKD